MSDAKSNGYDAIKPHVEAMEELDGSLQDLKIRYMNDCRELREAQKRRVKMVNAEGFSPVSFKAVLKHRRLAKKIDAIDEEMKEAEATESYEMMMDALGMLADLPLGQSVVEKARARSKKSAADVDELGSEHVKSNVTALKSGISPLT